MVTQPSEELQINGTPEAVYGLNDKVKSSTTESTNDSDPNRTCIDEGIDNQTNTTQTSSYNFSDSPVDLYIAAFIILLTTIGILGNLVSFSYFWRRRKKTIHDLLYLLISAFDALTSATSFPVIVSLLNSRDETLFANKVICHSWPVVFYLLMRVSMLLVVYLSVTRTLAIIKPLQRNNDQLQTKKMVFGMLLYSVILLTIDLLFLLTAEGSQDRGIKYIEYNSFCEMFESAHLRQNTEAGWSTRCYQTLLQLELILPCLVVFGSFLVSTTALLRRKAMLSDDEKKFRRISVTIGLFMALFLACYLPCFSFQLTFLVIFFKPSVVETLKNSGFQRYGYLLIQFVLPLLNAATNPCLYMLRMPHYRGWVIALIRRVIHPQRSVKSSTTKRLETTGVSRKGKEEELQYELKRFLKHPNPCSSRLDE